jgi:hypothetical protein
LEFSLQAAPNVADPDPTQKPSQMRNHASSTEGSNSIMNHNHHTVTPDPLSNRQIEASCTDLSTHARASLDPLKKPMRQPIRRP